MALQERQTIELHGVTLSYSPIQTMYNVLNYKSKLEETVGKLSSTQLANLYDKHIQWANPDDAATWYYSKLTHTHTQFQQIIIINYNLHAQVSASFIDTACTMGERVPWHGQPFALPSQL